MMNPSQLVHDPLFRALAINLTILSPAAIAWVVLTRLEKPVDFRVGLIASAFGVAGLVDVWLLWDTSSGFATLFGLQGVAAAAIGVTRLLKHLRTADIVEH